MRLWRRAVSFHCHSNAAFDLWCIQMLKCTVYRNSFSAFLHFFSELLCYIHSFRKQNAGVCCESHVSRDQRSEGWRKRHKTARKQLLFNFSTYYLASCSVNLRKFLSGLNLWVLWKLWIISSHCGRTSLRQQLEKSWAVLETTLQVKMSSNRTVLNKTAAGTGHRNNPS